MQGIWDMCSDGVDVYLLISAIFHATCPISLKWGVEQLFSVHRFFRDFRQTWLILTWCTFFGFLSSRNLPKERVPIVWLRLVFPNWRMRIIECMWHSLRWGLKLARCYYGFVVLTSSFFYGTGNDLYFSVCGEFLSLHHCPPSARLCSAIIPIRILLHSCMLPAIAPHIFKTTRISKTTLSVSFIKNSC